MKRTWDYIKKNNLLDPKDKRFLTLDNTMAPVFGSVKINGNTCMLGKLKSHLTKVEIFYVSPELAKIIGTKKREKIDRSQCMKRVWAYIKKNNLLDPKDKRFFTPDNTMAAVFGSVKIMGTCMLGKLKKHMTKAGRSKK